MECNKEEAIRAMDTAVKRLYDRDYAGAKQIALKAERLFPQLANISQLLAVCEVHSSSQLMANGLHDWYKIIQVDPESDDIQIKMQYRKLAFLLHPDKNKFPGAEAAFKLVGEANNTLSNRAKRIVYNLKRRHLVWSADSPENAETNGAKNSSSSNFNRTKRQKTQQQPQPQTQGVTFWTACPYCSIKLQYFRQILSKTVRCTCCSKTFKANELPHVNLGHASGAVKQAQQFLGQQPQVSGSCRPLMKSEMNLNPKPAMSNSSGLNTVTGQRKLVTANANKPATFPFPNQYSNFSAQSKFNSDVNPIRGDRDQTHGGAHAVQNGMPHRSSHKRPDAKSNGTDADVLSPDKKARVEGKGEQDGNDVMDASNTSNKTSTTVDIGVKEQDKKKGKDQVERSMSDRDQIDNGSHAVHTHMLPRRSPRNKPDVKNNGANTDVLSPALKARVEMKEAQDVNSQLDASHSFTKASTSVEKEVKEQYRENGKEQAEQFVSATDQTNDGTHAVLNSMPLRTFQCNKPDARSNNATPDVLSPAVKAALKGRMDASNTCTKAGTTVKRNVKEQNREKGNKQVRSSESVRDKDAASGTVNVDTCLNSSAKTAIGAHVALGSKFSQESVVADDKYGYPDAEFHDFDRCRTHNNFHRGQVWALYSELDTYPKYYGWIRKVEHEPFKVHVSWLEACPWLKGGWLDADLPISCGNFRVTNEKMIYDKSDYFSHMVTVCVRGKYYEILPKVGEIWAIYKDWSARWTLHDFETCEFNIVQIRKQREESFEVLPMRKVPQYKSVFVPEVDVSGPNTWEVPAIMFSHKIPAICLTEEQGGKLRGFWELDPASVPYAFFNCNK